MEKTNSDLMAELVIELKNSRNTLSLEDFAQVIKEAIHKDDLEILIKLCQKKNNQQ